MKELKNVLEYIKERTVELSTQSACLDNMKDIASAEDILKKKNEVCDARIVLANCQQLLVDFLYPEEQNDLEA